MPPASAEDINGGIIAAPARLASRRNWQNSTFSAPSEAGLRADDRPLMSALVRDGEVSRGSCVPSPSIEQDAGNNRAAATWHGRAAGRDLAWARRESRGRANTRIDYPVCGRRFGAAQGDADGSAGNPRPRLSGTLFFARHNQ